MVCLESLSLRQTVFTWLRGGNIWELRQLLVTLLCIRQLRQLLTTLIVLAVLHLVLILGLIRAINLNFELALDLLYQFVLALGLIAFYDRILTLGLVCVVLDLVGRVLFLLSVLGLVALALIFALFGRREVFTVRSVSR